jgi:signal transduction histidine kinase
MAKSVLTNANPKPIFYTQIEHNAQGYTLLPDINNKPLLILQVQTQNSIYEAGQQSVWYILVILLVAGAVFGFVIVWLSERIVISRIAFLDRRIAEISTSNDLSARIMMQGDDELARLTATINDSLAKREQSQEEQFRTLNTELTRLNGELETKVADLKANRKYKDRFFSHASHELRTPLAIMRTRLYLARKKPEQWENHIDRLDETMARLLNVIDDVFDMTKLQDQSPVISAQPADLKAFVEMVLEGKAGRLAEKQLRFNKQFTDEALPVNLDPTLFDRACDKLVECAIEYGEPESEIVIRLYAWRHEDSVNARMEIACPAFQFPPDELEEMFSPFYQVSEGKKYTTGLNLAIARQIVILHGGTLIALNNEAGSGCFRITLPLVSDART